jgi:penicillin-insensitive murein endopeptidase
LADEPHADAAEMPSDPHGDSDMVDDDEEGMDEPARPAPAATSPLLKLSDEELVRKYRTDPASIGSLSIGRPAMGLLVNGVPMPKGDAWTVMGSGAAFGTEETVASIAHCIGRVREKFPNAPALSIGHISAKQGGHLVPHRSHQAGRDVDIAYYRKDGQVGFLDSTRASLDPGPTWALVKAALVESPVEMIFIDDSIQKLLAEFALAHGEDAAFVDDVFLSRGKNGRAPIRHIHGHRNHLHIRFHSPNAEALALRLARVLPKPKPPPPRSKKGRGHDNDQPTAGYSVIRARSGDTLVVWAKRYGLTVEEIQAANGLHGTALKIGAVYRIPKKGPPAASPWSRHGTGPKKGK